MLRDLTKQNLFEESRIAIHEDLRFQRQMGKCTKSCSINRKNGFTSYEIKRAFGGFNKCYMK